MRNEIYALANDVRWPLTQTQRDRLIDATLALDDAIRPLRKELIDATLALDDVIRALRKQLIDATLAFDDAIRALRKDKQPEPVTWRQALGDDPQ